MGELGEEAISIGEREEGNDWQKHNGFMQLI
jgi:hypothetical protein